MSRKFLSIALLAAIAGVLAAQNGKTAINLFDGKSWWGYVQVLAADNMEGRETGSEGLRRAEAYVVEQLQKDELEPAGTKGFYQPVQFHTRRVVEEKSSLALLRNGKVEPLVIGEDAMFNERADLAPEIEAPLVFVGYGLRVPEMHYDDLGGLDLKGKVAVVLDGAPAEIPGPLAAHYGSAAERWKVYRQLGLVGVIRIQNPATQEIPWARQARTRGRAAMMLADPELDETAGQKVGAVFNPERAEKLFDGSGHTLAELLAISRDRKQLPRFPLACSIRSRVTVERHEVESSNVIARLEGSDLSLKDQYVALSAHVDHLGIGAPINGDRIYNGAMDNASGSAVLLDIAAELSRSHARLKRSLLFVFVTGEEKGLLGSKYYAAHPTVPLRSIVADINTDMFLPIIPLKILTVYGLRESDLGDMATRVAQQEGVEVQDDPQPQRNVFIRSDQYSFIRQGVPALDMAVGFQAGSKEAEINRVWLRDRYHAPSDDLNQPVDLAAAAGYEGIVRNLVVAVADAANRPQWKQNSFFRRYAESSN